jgi:monofunctional biosynthetic peptidoglycan transglycosylase
MRRIGPEITRLLGLLLLCALALQLYFLGRVALMAFVAPESTSFQRSEVARLIKTQGHVDWSQEWVPESRLPDTLRRAVIASEDAGFTSHGGIDWEAVKSAWQRNHRAADRAAASRAPADRPNGPRGSARVVGGSTISQQLAKNLFLSGERTTLRKAQEALITFMLEALLDKSRNGERSGAKVVEHFRSEALVLWAWAPGGKRKPPSVSHPAFVKAAETWIAAGAACPAS